MLNKKKPLIIGDIHGCYFEFLQLLEKTGYSKTKHRLILLGDLINRGPHSFKVLKWARDNKAEIIMGNHERGFLKGIKKEASLNALFVELKEQMGEELQYWTDWIASWPYFIEDRDFIVVHGGLVPGESPQNSDSRLLANIRTWDGRGIHLTDESNPPWYEFYKGKKLVVYGHWAKQGLKIRENTIGLDSGCVYGQKLSALLLPERKIFQVSAQKNYCSF